MIQHDDTENAFLPELVFGGTGSQPVWGYRLLACTTGETPVVQTGETPLLPNGRGARAPSEFGDVVECGVKLGPEAAAVVFAQDLLVGDMANALSDLSIDTGFEGGGVDVMAPVGIAVAKGSTVVEVDVGIGLQGAVGTVCALANGVDRREGDFCTEGFYLAHADGVDVAEDYIRDALGGDVAVVFLVGIDVVRSPLGVFETSGTFLVCMTSTGWLTKEPMR